MPASLNPFRALRHRNFLLFWSGQTLSLIGTWMQSMAEGWLAFELTRNAFLVGLVAASAARMDESHHDSLADRDGDDQRGDQLH